MSGSGARFLVLLETSGNQRYIFASNKRRENVGASELITKVGGDWLDTALPKNAKVLTRTSGKALVLLDGGDPRSLVFEVTRRALAEAPSLDVAGAVLPLPVGQTLREATREVHRVFQAARAARPGPEVRFHQLPFLDFCSSSGLPASKFANVGAGPERRSATALAKLQAFESGLERMGEAMGRDKEELRRAAEYLEGGDGRQQSGQREERAEWVGVVHADGNGLGRLFESLGHDGVKDDEEFAGLIRAFSAAVERCTLWALRRAVESTWPGAETPLRLLPLVLGGDDVTVLVDGPKALDFTIAYLERFERFAMETDLFDEDALAAKAIQQVAGGPLSACAGVAIVKPHFPFSEAHQLAVDLASSAKHTRRVHVGADIQSSMLDFHLLYDSSSADLRRIRDALIVRGGAVLTAKPYVVTPMAELANRGASNGALEWASRRTVEVLRNRVGALAGLPRSQAHDLRSGLRAGREVANRRFKGLKARYGGIGILGADGADKLFWNEGTDEAASWVTGFLDAMDACGFVSPPAATVAAQPAQDAS